LKSGSGIVIEVNNRKATLLMKDGTFVTVRVPAGKNPSVGREYQASYFSERKRSLFVLPSVAAILAVVLLSGLIPIGSKSAAAAYVSFDINPSLEVGVDKEMQVIQIDAFNDEAKKIIDKYDLNVENQFSFEDFADQLIKAYEEEGYMESDHSMLITTISSDEGNDKTEAALDQAVNSIVKKTVVKYPVRITVSESNPDTREKAKQLGVSSGKYKAFQTANINGKTLTEEKIKEVNFQELKVNTLSSNDIQSLPHPRKIKTEGNERKNDIKIAVPKKAVSQPKEVKKHKEKHHNHDNHHNKKQEKLVKPKERKLNNSDNKLQNRALNSNKQKNNEHQNRNANNHHKKNQQDRNKQDRNKEDRDKHRNKH
jgi:hypothetical protein